MSDDKKDTTPTPPSSENPDETSAADVEILDNENPGEADIPTSLPVLPVRDIVVFNYMILPCMWDGKKAFRPLTKP